MARKERSENDFRELLKTRPDTWHYKFMVSRFLRGRAAPADFIILTKQHRYLCEVKQCKNEIFEFKRLTQKETLDEFENKHENNHSFILICFWMKNKASSAYYMIPIKRFNDFADNIGKVSCREKDLFAAGILPTPYEDLMKFII
jgi:hypothetical protein